jgi:hypothetical protein
MQAPVRLWLLCQWSNASATPPAQPFSYEPSNQTVIWNDVNGIGHTGNLAVFNATADMASVTKISLLGKPITSISNIGSLPSLNNLTLKGTLLASFDITHNPLLSFLDCSSCVLIASLDITHNPVLTSLTVKFNPLTILDISQNPLLVTIQASSMNLMSSSVNTILSLLVSFGHTGGTVNLVSQTPAAPPTVGPPNGIVAKAALLAEAPPWTVSTD